MHICLCWNYKDGLIYFCVTLSKTTYQWKRYVCLWPIMDKLGVYICHSILRQYPIQYFPQNSVCVALSSYCIPWHAIVNVYKICYCAHDMPLLSSPWALQVPHHYMEGQHAFWKQVFYALIALQTCYYGRTWKRNSLLRT